jgi:branched-chain amino acid transport system substrate-binding protein
VSEEKLDAGVGLDRATLLKRAGLAAAAASGTLAGAQGAWAGLTRPAALKELRIGHLSTLSGPNGQPGIDLKQGIVTYIKSHGSKLGGRKIRLIDADDALDPPTAIRQVQKLVGQDKVDVILGIVYSNILLAVRDTIDQLKAPTVVANAAANAITRDRKSTYIFRTSYTNWQLGAPAGRYAAQRWKDGLVAVAANYAAGQESAAAFRDAYQAGGGKLLGDTIFTPFPTTPDYQPYLSQIQSRGPQAVWIFPAAGTESIKFAKAFAQFGLKGKIALFGNNNLVDPQSVTDAIGDAGLGIRTTTPWSKALKNAENRRFLGAYNRFGGNPSAFATVGYIATQFLDLSLKKLNGDTSNKTRFIRAMEQSGTWLAPSGLLTMDPATHNVTIPVYVQEFVKTSSGYGQQLRATIGRYKDPGK